MRMRRTSSGVEVWAPAKLNLYLEILGKRPDGYHELETVMVPIALWDTLTIQPAPAGVFELNIESRLRTPPSEPIPTDRRNLIVRALEALAERANALQISQAGARVHLVKRIPAEAGLAGGSTDAAAAIAGAAALWGLNLGWRELSEVGAAVGSDVPFFLAPYGHALCQGRGEQLSGADLPFGEHFVIVVPPEKMSTAGVYRAFAEFLAGESKYQPRQIRAPLRGSLVRFNRLQQIAEQLEPRLAELRHRISKYTSQPAQMTGSGSAYFAACRSHREATRTAQQLKQLRLGDVFVARDMLPGDIAA